MSFILFVVDFSSSERSSHQKYRPLWFETRECSVIVTRIRMWFSAGRFFLFSSIWSFNLHWKVALQFATCFSVPARPLCQCHMDYKQFFLPAFPVQIVRRETRNGEQKCSERLLAPSSQSSRGHIPARVFRSTICEREYGTACILNVKYIVPFR